MSTINQKEYLKKYLGLGRGDKKKKKKKSKTVSNNRLKIVDDNVDVSISDEIKEDLKGENEDAPQIVAVVDERPPSLRIDEETRSNLWKPIGGSVSVEESNKISGFQLNKQIKINAVKKTDEYLSRYTSTSKSNETRRGDSTPPRKNRRNSDDNSPIRIKEEVIDDNSSPRKRNREYSPSSTIKTEDYSPPRRKQNDDNSPPRRRKNEDNSPPRRNRIKDNSPPRRRNEDDLPLRSDDMSPPRKNRREEDNSPPRRRKSKDMSPPRKNNLPLRRRKSEDISPPKRKEKSPSHKRKSRWGEEETSDKMKKTLDGKTPGLQRAAELVKETAVIKQKENELFKSMSAEISGANAATVVRNRKVRDLEAEAEKAQRERENKEKYNRWGKGLKQVGDQQERMAEEMYEMTKPLARYADDRDLETYLKEQEREGDPMLAYIRKKKKKEAIETGVPVKPTYAGEFMPNRFGIRPGYRWDGVDRSSGYEKKWFEIQNAKKADREESYRWNTEDM